jgi:predicted dehydrogenase
VDFQSKSGNCGEAPGRRSTGLFVWFLPRRRFTEAVTPNCSGRLETINHKTDAMTAPPSGRNRSEAPGKYRAAIIGTGRIASLLERDPLRAKPHTHAAHYRTHPCTDLAAGCDLDPERLAMFGHDWDIAVDQRYSDYRTMLEDERPDIVSVCAYAPDRLRMCRDALEAGARGLWIEKAVAASVDEAREIDRLVRATGAAAIVDHPRRSDTRYRAVARWIRDQTFGPLESIHVLFSGHLIHTGTHAWDLLLDWCGPWARVQARLDTDRDESARDSDGRLGRQPALPPQTVDTIRDRGGRARIVFENGVEAFVSGGAKAYFVFQCDLVFSRGRVRIGNDVWEVATPAESPRYSGFLELATQDPAPFVEASDVYATPMLADLVLAMQGGPPPLQSVASAVSALELGIAVLQAGLADATVTPATVDPSLRVFSV